MGFLSDLFIKKKQVNTSKLVNFFTPYFGSVNSPELNETFVSAVNTHALHFSKIRPGVYLNGNETKKAMSRLLSQKPNPLMEAGAFWEKVCKLYWTEYNVFLYADWSVAGLRALWILDPNSIEISQDKNTGELYFKFFLNDKIMIESFENIIHIARDVDRETEIFGKRDSAINTVLNVINTNYTGIANAIKTSQFLRFVINSTTVLNDTKRQELATKFAETYLSTDGTGIAYLDATSTLTQVNNQAKYANKEEMAFFEDKIYNWLHISPKIIKGEFSENEWQAYYETSIEPLLRKLTNELNFKLLTQREYDVGNKIIVQANDLQVISTATRISLIEKTKEIGLFTVNEGRQLFGLPPIENGDNRLVSLNYINSSIADQYQQNKVGGNENGNGSI